MWYVIPLVICISLVYAATHHEPMSLIIWRAFRTFSLDTRIYGFCVYYSVCDSNFGMTDTLALNFSACHHEFSRSRVITTVATLKLY